MALNRDHKKLLLLNILQFVVSKVQVGLYIDMQAIKRYLHGGNCAKTIQTKASTQIKDVGTCYSTTTPDLIPYIYILLLPSLYTVI